MSNWHDLGSGHRYSLTSWSPDRELNPQYEHVPDVDPCGAMVEHLTPSGEKCMSHINFDVPHIEHVAGGHHVWQLHSLEPLHVEPSLLCRRCGDHGFIRDGVWVTA